MFCLINCSSLRTRGGVGCGKTSKKMMLLSRNSNVLGYFQQLFSYQRSSISLSTLFFPLEFSAGKVKYSCVHLTVFYSLFPEKKKVTMMEWSVQTSQPSISWLEDLTLVRPVARFCYFWSIQRGHIRVQWREWKLKTISTLAAGWFNEIFFSGRTSERV